MTPTDAQVERVAKALAVANGVNPDGMTTWKSDDPVYIWTIFCPQARAAIAAMPALPAQGEPVDDTITADDVKGIIPLSGPGWVDRTDQEQINALGAKVIELQRQKAELVKALEAAKEFADDEFSDCNDLNRKNRISALCDKIDAALALMKP